jgi:GntR family transcriptional regulator / MocR family aminotransferase
LRPSSKRYLPDFRRVDGIPLRRQISDFLKGAIAAGELRGVLPPTRALAQRLGVSRKTAVAAYEELAQEGLITSRRGSGTRVRERGPLLCIPELRVLLRESQYPVDAKAMEDLDGNVIYVHR